MVRRIAGAIAIAACVPSAGVCSPPKGASGVLASRTLWKANSDVGTAVLLTGVGVISTLILFLILNHVIRRKTREISRLLAEARETSRLKSEFLANMSHEIRTPMNGIIGMTDLALSTPLNEEQREYLGMVKTSADSLLRVINDILDFSRIEAGKLELDQVDFEVRQVVLDTCRGLAFRAHEKKLELVCEIATAVPPLVAGDPFRLRQILVNLVGNAIKFTGQGEVEIRCGVQPALSGGVALQFTVRDTGIGIPEGKQKEIFSAFTQADGSITRQYGGTGLGLTISAQLVRMMGGRIWIESKLHEGTAFHFTVVLQEAQGQGTQGEPAREQRVVSLAGRRVLVVDDNLTNLRMLKASLREFGMTVTTADRGQIALDLFKKTVTTGTLPELLLLDVQMPDMDGFTLAERLQEHSASPRPAIMMLCSVDLAADASRCREMGIAAYLMKPVGRVELKEAITRVLGSDSAKPQQRALVAQEPRTASPRETIHILLAEDNVVNQRLIATLLERYGYRIQVVSTGAAVLAALERDCFDLILMDVQMPEMDGFQATAHIREHEDPAGERIPILALTAHAIKGYREQCLAAGMDEYLTKPFQTDELIGKIRTLLGDRTVVDPEPDYTDAQIDDPRSQTRSRRILLTSKPY